MGAEHVHRPQLHAAEAGRDVDAHARPGWQCRRPLADLEQLRGHLLVLGDRVGVIEHQRRAAPHDRGEARQPARGTGSGEADEHPGGGQGQHEQADEGQVLEVHVGARGGQAEAQVQQQERGQHPAETHPQAPGEPPQAVGGRHQDEAGRHGATAGAGELPEGDVAGDVAAPQLAARGDELDDRLLQLQHAADDGRGEQREDRHRGQPPTPAGDRRASRPPPVGREHPGEDDQRVGERQRIGEPQPQQQKQAGDGAAPITPLQGVPAEEDRVGHQRGPPQLIPVGVPGQVLEDPGEADHRGDDRTGPARRAEAAHGHQPVAERGEGDEQRHDDSEHPDRVGMDEVRHRGEGIEDRVAEAPLLGDDIERQGDVHVGRGNVLEQHGDADDLTGVGVLAVDGEVAGAPGGDQGDEEDQEQHGSPRRRRPAALIPQIPQMNGDFGICGIKVASQVRTPNPP